MAWTKSRRVIPGCMSPWNFTSTLSGISNGIIPVAAANATKPDPAGNEIPMGKRVWESPPVPTVSGSNIRFNQLWMIPSPGRNETPPRVRIKSGRVWWVTTSTGLGYAAVWQNDCITRSALNPKQAKERNSSRVIGPVVSWDPTVVIFGSQYVPGNIPSNPQAFPTIFCAKVYPSEASAVLSAPGITKTSCKSADCPNASRALAVSPRPMMSGIRPPARTSSRMIGVFNVKFVTTSPVSARLTTPCCG